MEKTEGKNNRLKRIIENEQSCIIQQRKDRNRKKSVRKLRKNGGTRSQKHGGS